MVDTCYLYGDIGESYWSEGVSSTTLMAMLKELDPSAPAHHIRINSPGGLVSEGLTMGNLLLAHIQQIRNHNPKFDLVTHCDGYCMSAATIPFMAGTIRSVSLGGIIMVHNASNYVFGNSADMRQCADQLDVLSEAAANVYATRCVQADGRDVAYFKKLMDAETYMTGAEAVNHGMATIEDVNTTATLNPNLTPEKMRGHYIELMTTKRVRTFAKPPTDSRQLLERKAAFAKLDQLLLEFGVTK